MMLDGRQRWVISSPLLHHVRRFLTPMALPAAALNIPSSHHRRSWRLEKLAPRPIATASTQEKAPQETSRPSGRQPYQPSYSQGPPIRVYVFLLKLQQPDRLCQRTRGRRRWHDVASLQLLQLLLLLLQPAKWLQAK